ncbi:DUF721 domain-containing protein [Leucobacter weissii]|uniref:DUF721 domain-containing protein n=1 Tax=Leucobacter weissii TaxID=1983706 RepID=A0A939SBD5_9MICO|nr:DciA family protein [Leucobacter weissii]MBO1901273.1 DUF721 domain-containing protein [Leucobacter weissii]
MRTEEVVFASEAYQRAKALWKGRIPPSRTRRVVAGTERSVPFGKGRDPRSLGELLDLAARDMGWTVELDQARLISDWHRFVGDAMAAHTEVIEIRDGALVVQCDSTTWATELRRLRGEILTRILDAYPEVELRELRFLAPGAPSWKHGPRSVPGRGPRDTYG